MARTVKLSVMHSYTITIDEDVIDKEGEPYGPERQVQFHRMFQAICADQPTLQDVCIYEVLAKHDAITGEGFGYVETEYEQERMTFVEVLLRHEKIFAPEDLALLQAFLKRYKENDDFDLDLQVEPLQHCFLAQTESWHLH